MSLESWRQPQEVFTADRMQVMVPVTPVSELVLPIGHWVAVGLWTLSMMRLASGNRRQVIFRCIGVGFALHALILVALFVPRLDDRAAFSARVYLIYARLVCVMTVALSTAWLLGWVATDANGLGTSSGSRPRCLPAGSRSSSRSSDTTC